MAIPAVGAGAAILGTLGAVSTVQKDLTAPALVLPAALMTAGLLVPIVGRISTDARQMLKTEHFILVGLVYWLLLDLLQSAYPLEELRQDSVTAAFTAIGLFAVAVWIGALGSGWALPRPVRNSIEVPLSDKGLFVAIVAAFFLGMQNYLIPSGYDLNILLEGLMADRWSAPWSRHAGGGAFAFIYHLNYFGFLLPSLTVLLVFRKRWYAPQCLVAVASSIVFLMFLAQDGNRRSMGAVLGAAVLTVLLVKPKLNFARVAIAAGCGALLLASLQEILKYRGVGIKAVFTGDAPPLPFSHLHVDDNFLRLGQIIELFPSQVNFVYLQPIYHALTLPIPRLFWPGKPDGPGFDLPELINWTSGSLSASVVGELYASGGMIGVVLGGLVFGRLASMWNRLLALPPNHALPMVYGVGLMAVFVGLRSMQALVQISYVVVAWLVLAWMLRSIAVNRQPIRRVSNA